MSSLLLFGDTERSAAMRHEIPLAIIDPFLFAEIGGRRVVLTNLLERDRIAGVLPEAELLDMFELGMRDLITEDGLTREEAVREVVSRAVAQIGLREAIVPGDFPLAVADRLRADGVRLTVDDAAVELRRRAKSGLELEGIRNAQRAAEAGMAAAAALLARAEPGTDGRLHIDGAELHAEQVRAALRAACAEYGAPCPPDVIVASVWNGTGHEPGSGPLPAGLPIQIDLWPRDEATGCWADMTRTFVVGDPTAEHAELIAAQEELVRAALEDARAGRAPARSGASSTTPPATASRPPATAPSAPARRPTTPPRASSSRSATASASRCTRRRASALPAASRSSWATCWPSSRACGTAASAACATRTCCWSPATAARR